MKKIFLIILMFLVTSTLAQPPRDGTSGKRPDGPPPEGKNSQRPDGPPPEKKSSKSDTKKSEKKVKKEKTEKTEKKVVKETTLSMTANIDSDETMIIDLLCSDEKIDRESITIAKWNKKDSENKTKSITDILKKNEISNSCLKDMSREEYINKLTEVILEKTKGLEDDKKLELKFNKKFEIENSNNNETKKDEDEDEDEDEDKNREENQDEGRKPKKPFIKLEKKVDFKLLKSKKGSNKISIILDREKDAPFFVKPFCIDAKGVAHELTSDVIINEIEKKEKKPKGKKGKTNQMGMKNFQMPGQNNSMQTQQIQPIPTVPTTPNIQGGIF